MVKPLIKNMMEGGFRCLNVGSKSLTIFRPFGGRSERQFNFS